MINVYGLESFGLILPGQKSVRLGEAEYLRAEHGESRYSVKLLPGVARGDGSIFQAAPHHERLRDDGQLLRLGPREEWQGAILAVPAKLDFWRQPYAPDLNIWPGAEIQGRPGVESWADIPYTARKRPHVNLLIFSEPGATCLVFDQKGLALEVVHSGHGILTSTFVEVDGLIDEIRRLIPLFRTRSALNFVSHNLDRLSEGGHDVRDARRLLIKRYKDCGF